MLLFPLEAATTRNLGEDGSTMAEFRRRSRHRRKAAVNPRDTAWTKKGGVWRRGFVGSKRMSQLAKCPRSNGRFPILYRLAMTVYETLEGFFSFWFLGKVMSLSPKLLGSRLIHIQKPIDLPRNHGRGQVETCRFKPLPISN